MTNKIALEALKLAGFKNPTAIAQVLNYVPNPSAALEVILGIHEPTVVDKFKRFRSHKYSSHNEIIEITNYDDLGNLVEFKMYEPKTVTAYYLTKEDKVNNVYVLERPKNYDDWGYVRVNGFSEKTLSLKVEDFEEQYKNLISNDEAYNKLEEWDNYGVPVEKDPTDLYNAELV